MTAKTLLVVSLISASIALSGCGGSDSIAPDSNSKSTVAFANKSSFNYAQASIVNREGKETVFIGDVRCPSGATSCYINPDVTINAGDSLLFKNSSGVMVGAITAAETSSGYTVLSPSSLTTGFYLAQRLSSELLSESGISWDDFSQRTLTFFTNYDSPDGSVDQYEELGDYYATQITKTAESESAFLDALKLRLLNWEIVDPKVFQSTRTAATQFFSNYKTLFSNSNFTLISQAHAQQAPCNPVISKFFSIAGAAGKVIPVVGEAVAGAGKIGENFCKNSGDTKEILGQLTVLQNTVDHVSKSLATLSKFVFAAEINTKTTEFQELASAARQLNADYDNFLNGEKVASLEQFFVKAGSWEKGIEIGGDNLKRILNSPFKDGNGMYPRIMRTTVNADFDTYLSALSNKCGQLTFSSNDNFLLIRQICNNTIYANSGRLVAAQAVSLEIFKDIYATLSKYESFTKNNYQLPSDLKSFKTAYSDAKTSFTAQQVAMISKYAATTRTNDSIEGRGYFDVFAGLDTTLTSNLVKRECYQSEDRDRKIFPAIIGWYAPGSTDGARSYIETKCKVPTKNDRLNARYYHNNQGKGATPNNVANVLGVPIAAIYLENDRPLGNSWDNASEERLDYKPVSQDLYLDAPGVKYFGKGTSTSGVLAPTELTKSNGLSKLPHDPAESVWLTVPSKGSNFRYVAKIKIERQASGSGSNYYYSYLSCLTVPCRVNPNDNNLGLWLEGESNGLKLDLVDTRQVVSGRYLLRLETR